ncbi:MAG: hypothetical protein OSA06_07715 [Acidimicrobiales bacterium]|jgi:hypothetical protein|nr:hypothetical protein [Acidimicrobiales bacterium]
MTQSPALPTDRLYFEVWEDPLVDRLGYDPRSAYAETYWLGILGPSASWLLRHLATGFDQHPNGFDLELPDTAMSIGLRLNGGRHAPFMRTLGRLCQFRMARQSGPASLQVRRFMPPLTLLQLERLPVTLRNRHQKLMEASLEGPDAQQQRRARHLALTLLFLGEDLAAIERQLNSWRFSPEVCTEAARWAMQRQKIKQTREQRASASAKPALQTAGNS